MNTLFVFDSINGRRFSVVGKHGGRDSEAGTRSAQTASKPDCPCNHISLPAPASALRAQKCVPTKFSVIMTAFETFHFLPRALDCVCRQSHADWELLLVVDGPSPADRFSPQKLLEQMRRHFPDNRMDLWELPRATGCFGNVSRNFALLQATGDYVCWVNHDNLITPEYLAAHAENVAKTPGCLSVVDISLWQHDRYVARFPRQFSVNNIDLLCFAVPLAAAREVNAFGGPATRVYAADWLTFDECRKLLPIERNRRLVGTHF